MQRIENLVTPLDAGNLTLFQDNPVEFLCATIANELESLKFDNGKPIWAEIFGEYIDGYMRMDYDFRNLPALRIYNETGQKEGESWFINGDIKADVIFPASLRREETQQVQDTVTSALLQQFRSMTFFQAVSAKVPGLNELGKLFSWDKTGGFLFEEQMAPVTQITLNFRLDQRIWDDYLESQGRTKNQPFEVTLDNFRRLNSRIQALKDDGTDGPSVPSNQIIKGGS